MTTPDPSELVTLHMLAKGMQAVAETDARLIIETDTARQATEDFRSQRRNRNRVLMILVAWAATVTVPILAHVFNIPTLAQYAAGIGFTGDILVTGYSWLKKY